jgi:siroheme synthase (precorrin-2 oxidase/ferrochelatase)
MSAALRTAIDATSSAAKISTNSSSPRSSRAIRPRVKSHDEQATAFAVKWDLATVLLAVLNVRATESKKTAKHCPAHAESP